ncbi:DinB family protein [Streptomyces triticagri]|uniref:DinB family protein n=1 Tax=Streptomyces triticagri TaxID=2293568 RepID=A0A372MAQ9_9ACTN|nr:DinB family protein [Streptomyces triticagri]RFU87996.1 DinB family protein [Streptomyces triticagri]
MADDEVMTGGEKESLRAGLDRHRDVVLWKLRGLDDEQLRRPLTPTGTNLLGLVKHLACCEYGWFCLAFDRPAEPLPVEEDADFRAGPEESTEDILAFYARARAAADRTIDALEPEDLGEFPGGTVSLRWVLIHMIEETARHTGHMDIIRELIDGSTGDFPQA